MSKILLSKEAIEKNGLSVSGAIFLVALFNKVDFKQAKDELIEGGFISEALNCDTYQKEGYFVTRKGSQVLASIILDSDKVVGALDFTQRIDKLVPLMQDMYPKGKNFNNQYWRGNKTDIRRRLQTFFKRYGGEFTDEQILDATKAYVTGFNGEYKFMRLLQYFIWKEEVKDGMKIPISELANYIENADQANESLSDNWTTTLS